MDSCDFFSGLFRTRSHWHGGKHTIPPGSSEATLKDTGKTDRYQILKKRCISMLRKSYVLLKCFRHQMSKYCKNILRFIYKSVQLRHLCFSSVVLRKFPYIFNCEKNSNNNKKQWPSCKYSPHNFACDF